MILSEEETKQRPKLPTDPSIGPTNREPQANVATSSSHRRPSSPNPTLPDYETSQAQQPSTPKQRGGWRFWNSRVRKLLLYALVVYTSIALVISIPTFVFRSNDHHKFKWEPVNSFADPGLPPPSPPPNHKQMGLSPPKAIEVSTSCNAWTESETPHGKPTTAMAAGIAGMMHMAFPLVEGIALRLNLSSHELKGYVAGSLTVDMNTEENVSGAVLTANAQYSNLTLLRASSVCRTQFGNATEIMIHIPKRADNSSDTIQMDLQLLLPRTSTPTDLGMFVTNIPMFKHIVGNLSHFFFEHFKIVDPASSITVGSLSAASLLVQTSGAEISGSFSASDKLYLDTINGAVFANVSLLNNSPKKTKLSIETGNGPIVANVQLSLDENAPRPPGPKHRNFIAKIRTFNAPMNVSILHAKQSKPGRLSLMAENVLGPMDVTIDSKYTGTFDVRAKASTVQVLEMTGPDAPASSSRDNGSDDDDGDDGDHDEGYELHFVDVSPERTRGWIGDRRPEEFDRRSLGRVELINSLSPIRLHIAGVQSSNTTQR